ncbi:hypothetical protein [Streptomyces sp. NPDC002104]
MATPALLSTVLLLSGCSGSPSASPSASSSSSAAQSGPAKGAVDPKQADFFQCLKEKGLPMKETDSNIPVVDSSKADPAKVKEAEVACESRRSVPAATAEELAQAKAFTACMRASGVADFPDPDPRTAEHRMEELGLKDSPQGAAALKKCGGRPQSVTSGQSAG